MPVQVSEYRFCCRQGTTAKQTPRKPRGSQLLPAGDFLLNDKSCLPKAGCSQKQAGYLQIWNSHVYAHSAAEHFGDGAASATLSSAAGEMSSAENAVINGRGCKLKERL